MTETDFLVAIGAVLLLAMWVQVLFMVKRGSER